MVTPIATGNVKPPEWPYSLNRIHPMFQSLSVGRVADWVVWEGGGVPTDISGFANLITLPGGSADPVWGTGPEGAEWSFDGGDHAILDPASNQIASQDLITNPFSITLRFRTTDAVDSVVFIGLGNSASTDPIVLFQNQSATGGSGFKALIRSNGSNTIARGTTSTTHRDGQAHQAIVTWDTTNIRLWLDGVELTTENGAGTPAASTFNRYTLGALRRTSTSNQAEVEILRHSLYNRILVPSEVDLLEAYPYGDITPWWNLQAMISKAAAAAIRRQIIMFG